MSSFPVNPRYEPIVGRTYAALQALGDAFETRNPAGLALEETLQNVDLLTCGDIDSGDNDQLCSTLHGFCQYDELTVNQGYRFRELLTPLSRMVTNRFRWISYDPRRVRSTWRRRQNLFDADRLPDGGKSTSSLVGLICSLPCPPPGIPDSSVHKTDVFPSGKSTL